jgi:hypothetical protein
VWVNIWVSNFDDDKIDKDTDAGCTTLIGGNVVKTSSNLV